LLFVGIRTIQTDNFLFKQGLPVRYHGLQIVSSVVVMIPLGAVTKFVTKTVEMLLKIFIMIVGPVDLQRPEHLQLCLMLY
jgi:hypothetical protein